MVPGMHCHRLYLVQKRFARSFAVVVVMMKRTDCRIAQQLPEEVLPAEHTDCWRLVMHHPQSVDWAAVSGLTLSLPSVALVDNELMQD